MFNKIKFLAFTYFMLSSYNSMAVQADQNSKAFSNWSYSCEVNQKDSKNKLCSISQVVSSKVKDEKTKKDVTNNLAIYKIAYFKSEKGKDTLKFLQTVPLGNSLQAGTAIITQNKEKQEILAKGIYTICYAQGCVAVTDINDEIIAKISSDANSSIAFVSSENKTLALPISNDGLKEAFQYLKKHK
jgi:invasion protein IalB